MTLFVSIPAIVATHLELHQQILTTVNQTFPCMSCCSPTFIKFTTLLYKLIDHTLQKLRLLHQKQLNIPRLKNLSSQHPLPFRPQPIPYTLLEDFQPILRIFRIQFVQIADSTDAGEDALVLDEWGSRPEGRYHADALAVAMRAECLVGDVAALHDDGGALEGVGQYGQSLCGDDRRMWT